ncbi:hypothetical protein [Shiella aurantiaca]|uniref:hypothetical protein n=1 Tax=Shiella aurantiaca TaxID=3058365 RepID=UPI0029F4A697|nr:hypothetical protein [Shiella aurantiaca]
MRLKPLLLYSLMLLLLVSAGACRARTAYKGTSVKPKTHKRYFNPKRDKKKKKVRTVRVWV